MFNPDSGVSFSRACALGWIFPVLSQKHDGRARARADESGVALAGKNCKLNALLPTKRPPRDKKTSAQVPLRRRGWTPVFGKGLSPRRRGSRSTINVEWDDESKTSHPTLVPTVPQS